jgi:hypothetical protein
VFRTAAGRATLDATGVSLVNAPRRDSWGKGGSASVNSVRGPEPIDPGGDVVRVEIELQSGDVLQIDARAIVIAPVA